MLKKMTELQEKIQDLFKKEYGYFTCQEVADKLNLKPINIGKALKKLKALNKIESRESCSETTPVYWWVEKE